jgi:hypothetical protein
MVYTMIVMVYTMVYIYGIYHDIYYLPLWYIPWYIPKVVYTTFGVVYTMRQPSRCIDGGLAAMITGSPADRLEADCSGARVQRACHSLSNGQ